MNALWVVRETYYYVLSFISLLFSKCLFFYAKCQIKHRWTNNYTFAFLINVKQNTLIKSYSKIWKF
ncbi:hypothetical protein HanIR_Chr02g0061601 [Helianthus annuus]|nr:hypothetical protein HanIR_Chr02g0061601 [Helianthus annuus]